jgi:hypothetical protein
MVTLRPLCSHRVRLLAVLLLLSAGPAAAEDIPAFERAFGWPAIEPITSYYDVQFPPIAADESRVYVGLRQINVYTRDGEWLEFWPFSSPVRGLGDVLPYADSDSQVTDLALGGTDWLYVLDHDYGAVHIYSRDGGFIGGWGGHGDAPQDLRGPRAICVSDEGSVYVLDGDLGRIVQFDADGQFINAWETLKLPEPYNTTTDDIAPAPGGGVWAVIDARYFDDASEQWVRDIRLHRYGPDGAEVTSWQIEEEQDDLRIDSDSAGNVWVGGKSLQQFRPDGTKLAELDGAGWTRGFCITPDSQVVYLRATPLGTEQHDFRDTICYIEAVHFDGEDAGEFGRLWSAGDVGMLWKPRSFAIGPDGSTYARSDYGTSYYQYLFHFGPDGALLESAVTEEFPIYNPATQTVELLDHGANFAGPTGAYTFMVSDIYWEPPDERGIHPDGRWVVELRTYPGGDVFLKLTAPDAQEGFWQTACWGDAWSQLRSGHILFALYATRGYPEEQPVLWVATLTPQGKLTRSVRIQNPSDDWWPSAVAVDDGGAIYIGAYTGVWKFSPDGASIGRVGGWVGEGDQRDAMGSLVLDGSDLDIDPIGRLRVLDYAANRVVVFAYAPAPFPDVPYYHWAKDAVRAAVAAGIVHGYEDGQYAPAQPVRRDQMAVYIARALAGGDANVPPGPLQATFSDVPPEQWAYDHVEYCVSADIVEGIGEGQYGPAEAVDRAQMAVYIARLRGWVALGDDMTSAPELFPDVPAGHWAGTGIEACVENDVVQGYEDGLYRPDATVTRAETAVFICRAFGL